jgi:hypothetical protein
VIWGWLLGILFFVVAVVVVWLMVDSRLEQRQTSKRAVRRRTAEERLSARDTRNVRRAHRREVGLEDDDKRGLP